MMVKFNRILGGWHSPFVVERRTAGDGLVDAGLEKKSFSL
jgi:hypothetical protein